MSRIRGLGLLVVFRFGQNTFARPRRNRQGIFEISACLPLVVLGVSILFLLNWEEIYYWKVLSLSLVISLSHLDL